MTFTEATSSDRDFRRVGDNKSEFFWEGDSEDKELMERYLGSVRAPLFTWRDYFKGEFEFVEEEVIGVGDTIRLGEMVTLCEVTKIKGDRITAIPKITYEHPLSNAKLMSKRKAPRIHTFEGVILGIRGEVPGEYVIPIGRGQRDLVKLFPTMENKTYTMILKEEENDG